MNRISIVLLALLAACATMGTSYSGKSTTFDGDNILRNDVMSTIAQTERTLHSCHAINHVESEIRSVEQIEDRFHVEEVWTVTACGKSIRYPIRLREDAQGETDYSVGISGE